MPEGKKPSKLTVDFSDVGERRAGGKSLRAPEGDYLLQVVDAAVFKNKDKAGKHILWKLKVDKPKGFEAKGLVYHRTSLKKETLWSLRNFLEDLGQKIELSVMDIPLAKIVAKKPLIGATLQDGEPYDGKIKSEIAATFKASDYSEEAGSSKSDDDEDDDEDDDDDDDEDEDEDEEEEEKPKKKDKKKKSKKDDDDDDEDDDLDEIETEDL